MSVRRSESRKRCHDDSMTKCDVADLDGLEEFQGGHGEVLVIR